MKYFSAFQLGALHCFRHIFLFPDTVHIYSYGVCISCVNRFTTHRPFGTKWSQIRYVISVTLLSPSVYYLLTSAAMLPILYKYFHASVSMLTACCLPFRSACCLPLCYPAAQDFSRSLIPTLSKKLVQE